MAQSFIEICREQGFLLPPDVRDWLPVDRLAWFVIDAVAQMDLTAIYGAYRSDGHGAAAYEPAMMVTCCCTRRHQAAVFARDRASLSTGRGLSGDHG